MLDRNRVFAARLLIVSVECQIRAFNAAGVYVLCPLIMDSRCCVLTTSFSPIKMANRIMCRRCRPLPSSVHEVTNELTVRAAAPASNPRGARREGGLARDRRLHGRHAGAGVDLFGLPARAVCDRDCVQRATFAVAGTGLVQSSLPPHYSSKE